MNVVSVFSEKRSDAPAFRVESEDVGRVAPIKDGGMSAMAVMAWQRNPLVRGLIRINDANVINSLRSHEVGTAASIVSAFPEVRHELIPIQRAQLQPPGLVADGRDMGTVVFPDAPIKFYIDAPLRIRAQRRRVQLAESNQHASLDKLEGELRARDERDQQREHAPLIAADDAVSIDTSKFSIDEMVSHARNVIRERLSI